MDNIRTPKTQTVLVTVSVVVDAPADEDQCYERLMAVSQRLWQAAEGVCTAEPDCTSLGVSSYHYLENGSENARRCDRCRRWSTDVELPDQLDPLRAGSVIGDRFLCESCRVHLIEIGELPDLIHGWRDRPG